MTGLLDRILNHIADRENGMVRKSWFPSGQNCSTGVWKLISGVQFTPGIWLVAFGAGFAANANGKRAVNLGDTAADGGRTTATFRAVPTGDTRASQIRIIQVNSTVTYGVGCFQDSGSTLATYPWIEAVCIVPF